MPDAPEDPQPPAASDDDNAAETSGSSGRGHPQMASRIQDLVRDGGATADSDMASRTLSRETFREDAVTEGGYYVVPSAPGSHAGWASAQRVGTSDSVACSDLARPSDSGYMLPSSNSSHILAGEDAGSRASERLDMAQWLLERLREPLMAATRGAVTSAFDQHMPEISKSIGEAVRQQLNSGATLAPPAPAPKVLTAPSGICANATGSEGTESASLTGRESKPRHRHSISVSIDGIEPSVRRIKSDRSAMSGAEVYRVKTTRDVHNDLASRILAESGVRQQPTGGGRRRQSMGSKLVVPPEGRGGARPRIDGEDDGPLSLRQRLSRARAAPKVAPKANGAAWPSPLFDFSEAEVPGAVREDAARLGSEEAPPGGLGHGNSQASIGYIASEASETGDRKSKTGFNKVMTSSQVLEHRVNELVEIIPTDTILTERDGDAEVEDTLPGRFERLLLTTFRLVGLLSWDTSGSCPWLAALYKIVLISILACNLVWKSVEVFSLRKGVCLEVGVLWASACPTGKEVVAEALISAAALAFPVLLGLLGGRHRMDDLLAMLQGYAHHNDLVELWRQRVAWDVACMFLILVGTIVAQFVESVSSTTSWDERWIVCNCSRILNHLVLTISLSFLLYVLDILIVTVDIFSYRSVHEPDIPKATERWNIVQALLRKASSVTEPGFVALIVVCSCSVPVFIWDHRALGSDYVESLRLQVPHLLLLCGISRTFVVAAAATDKCTRVPSLINSLCFGEGSERRRQHLVEYIVQSAAGFYVCDFRLTFGMVTKFSYVSIVILFGFLGQELTRK